MHKRFKAKRKNKIKYYILPIILIYISFSLIYRMLYKNHIKNLSSEEIINNIIASSKTNHISNKTLNKIKSPEYILKYTLDINFIKDDPVSLEVKKDLSEEDNKKQYQIYLYSTHEKEEYKDHYLENYNIIPNVKTAQYIFEDYLKDLGISVLVENRSVTDILKANSWPYRRSYDASRVYVEETIKSHDPFDLIIDLHRDSSVLTKTLLEYNGKKYAKILFVVGAEHENYQANYKLVEHLNSLIEAEIPGLSRGISLKSGAGVNGIYNQDLSTKSILIELGGQYNEIEELNNTIEILAKVILKYIEGE